MAKPDQNFAVNYKVAMADILKADPNISVKDADQQATKAANEATVAYKADPTFYRIAIILLTIIVLAVVLGSVFLLNNGKSPTDGVIAIGSGAVGALIGLFSSQK